MNTQIKMKQIISLVFFICLLLTGLTCYSQAPNLLSYQAVIRNSNNELVSNTTVGVRISILSGLQANVLLYQEEHKVIVTAPYIKGQRLRKKIRNYEYENDRQRH